MRAPAFGARSDRQTGGTVWSGGLHAPFRSTTNSRRPTEGRQARWLHLPPCAPSHELPVGHSTPSCPTAPLWTPPQARDRQSSTDRHDRRAGPSFLGRQTRAPRAFLSSAARPGRCYGRRSGPPYSSRLPHQISPTNNGPPRCVWATTLPCSPSWRSPPRTSQGTKSHRPADPVTQTRLMPTYSYPPAATASSVARCPTNRAPLPVAHPPTSRSRTQALWTPQLLRPPRTADEDAAAATAAGLSLVKRIGVPRLRVGESPPTSPAAPTDSQCAGGRGPRNCIPGRRLGCQGAVKPDHDYHSTDAGDTRHGFRALPRRRSRRLPRSSETVLAPSTLPKCAHRGGSGPSGCSFRPRPRGLLPG